MINANFTIGTISPPILAVGRWGVDPRLCLPHLRPALLEKWTTLTNSHCPGFVHGEILILAKYNVIFRVITCSKQLIANRNTTFFTSVRPEESRITVGNWFTTPTCLAGPLVVVDLQARYKVEVFEGWICRPLGLQRKRDLEKNSVLLKRIQTQTRDDHLLLSKTPVTFICLPSPQSTRNHQLLL